MSGQLGIADGEPITLHNAHGVFHGRASVRIIRPGNAQAHWPEANVLLPRNRIDPDCGVPDYNAVVKVSRSADFNARSAISAMHARPRGR